MNIENAKLKGVYLMKAKAIVTTHYITEGELLTVLKYDDLGMIPLYRVRNANGKEVTVMSNEIEILQEATPHTEE